MAPQWRPGRIPWRTVLFVLAAMLVAWLAWEAWHWPDVSALARTNPRSTAFIDRYRAEERAAGRQPHLAWTWAPYAAISSHLKRAVLVAEDIRFFSHRGFEVSELRSAVEKALETGEPPRGASTITQQLAKNLWLSPSRNPVRKLKEALLTWQLERALPKRRILELYLNVVVLGPGIYGAVAASRRYFGKPASALGENEAAQLAAALPMPSRWHPGVTGAGYQRYVTSIKRRMGKASFLAREI
jgi:monofunctional biosynthetic peptidoglycan transglycosylase